MRILNSRAAVYVQSYLRSIAILSEKGDPTLLRESEYLLRAMPSSPTRNRKMEVVLFCVPFSCHGATFLIFFLLRYTYIFIFVDYSFCEKDHLTSQKEFFMYGQTSFSNTRIITRQTAHRYATVNTKIPSNVTGIASEAFQKKNMIQTIQFPSALSRIGARAFRSCNSLKSLSLPQEVAEIGTAAFADCVSMTTATLPASAKELPKDLFSENIKLKSVDFQGEDRLQMIHKNAFFRCQSLTSLVLPESVTEIEDRAFYRCKSLDQIYLPEGLKVIGNEAFYFCGIQTLQLPNSLEVLDRSAFFKCNNLEYVCLPRNVRHIGKWVFHGCNRLKVLEIRHDPEFIGEWIINRAATIRCYRGSKVDKYCQESGFNVEYLD